MTRNSISLTRILTVLVLLVFCGHVAKAVLHYFFNTANLAPAMIEDFDGRDLDDLNPRIGKQFCCTHSAQLVDLEAYGGDGRALAIELRPDDSDVKGSKRAEIRLPASHFNKPVWYHIRLFKEQADPSPVPVTLLQWHAVPDKILLEGNRAPPLRLVEYEDKNVIALNWDTAPRSFDRFDLFGKKSGQILWQGPRTQDAWQSWVFRVVWSVTEQGRITVWKDGERIVNYTGPTAYNDLAAPYMKAGIYVPRWKDPELAAGAAPRRLLIDDIWEIYPAEAGADIPPELQGLISEMDHAAQE